MRARGGNNCFRAPHPYARTNSALFLPTRSPTTTLASPARARYPSALPGVEEFVRGLWRNYPLAICSGALREEIEAMLEGVNLRDCFRVIVAAEDVTVGKPDPQGYLLTTRLLAEKTKAALTP